MSTASVAARSFTRAEILARLAATLGAPPADRRRRCRRRHHRQVRRDRRRRPRLRAREQPVAQPRRAHLDLHRQPDRHDARDVPRDRQRRGAHAGDRRDRCDRRTAPAPGARRRRLPRARDQRHHQLPHRARPTPAPGDAPATTSEWAPTASSSCSSLARERDAFTVGQAYDVTFAGELAGAGADLIVARCGLTQGGMVGPSADAESSLSIEAATEHVQAVIESARAQNPDVFVIAHGGPFARPADTEYLYANSDVQGILGESAHRAHPRRGVRRGRDRVVQEPRAAHRAAARLTRGDTVPIFTRETLKIPEAAVGRDRRLRVHPPRPGHGA